MVNLFDKEQNLFSSPSLDKGFSGANQQASRIGYILFSSRQTSKVFDMFVSVIKSVVLIVAFVTISIALQAVAV